MIKIFLNATALSEAGVLSPLEAKFLAEPNFRGNINFKGIQLSWDCGTGKLYVVLTDRICFATIPVVLQPFVVGVAYEEVFVPDRVIPRGFYDGFNSNQQGVFAEVERVPTGTRLSLVSLTVDNQGPLMKLYWLYSEIKEGRAVPLRTYA